MKLICYLSNGFPTIKESIELAKAYSEAGCDIIEIDFPSRDPYLEGDLITSRMEEALKNCDDYDAYMQGIERIKSENPNTQILLLVYNDTVEEIGKQKFIDFCIDNDLKDLIYIGEDTELLNELIEQGLKISCYVPFNLPEKEIQAAKESNGFLYLQAKPNGEEEINENYPTLKDCIKHLRSLGIEKEIYCGVGIRDTEDIKNTKDAKADGVFVGSTILKLYNDIPKLKAKIAELKEGTN